MRGLRPLGEEPELEKILEEHGMLNMLLGTLHRGCGGHNQGHRVTSCGIGLQCQQEQKAVVQVYHSLFLLQAREERKRGLEYDSESCSHYGFGQ